MKEKRKYSPLAVLISVYLCVSLIGIIMVTRNYNSLIKAHDSEITVDVNSLIAEKMNRSIHYMKNTVDEMATVLSYQDLLEPNQLYDQLLGSIPESEYVSIGVITNDGTVYGTDHEYEEMKKWNLLEHASVTKDVVISEPYRSSMNGKMVFTMFSPISQGGERIGCIFVTYPLSEIQNMANSSVLNNQAEIYLMNATSHNIILCSGSDETKIGKWSSTLLLKNQISTDTIDDYEEWETKMENGEKTATVTFSLDGVSYTQVYESIDIMEGWTVVARIPTDALSDTMQEFSGTTVAFVLMLILFSLSLFVLVRKYDYEEKARFEYLSTHDALTNLFNRMAFDSMVDNYLATEGRAVHSVVIFIDVDYFKQINDTYGHAIGDKALVTFAELLTKTFDKNAIIARYGGDEFVVLVKNVESTEYIDNKLELLKEEMKTVDIFGGDECGFEFHYSAGVAEYPDSALDYAELVKKADCALYEVKEKGRNGYKWYK